MKISLIITLLILSLFQFAPLWYGGVDANLQFASKFGLVLISLVLLVIQLLSKNSKNSFEELFKAISDSLSPSLQSTNFW